MLQTACVGTGFQKVCGLRGGGGGVCGGMLINLFIIIIGLGFLCQLEVWAERNSNFIIVIFKGTLCYVEITSKMI